MYISISIASAAIISFVAWLFFSNKKKINRPSYTAGIEKKKMTDFDTMLSNITQNPNATEVVDETKHFVPEHSDVHDREHIEHEAKHIEHKTEPEPPKFDLKNAMLGSNIIIRKKKSH